MKKSQPRRGRRGLLSRFGGLLRGLTGQTPPPKKVPSPQPVAPPDPFEELKIARPKSRLRPPQPTALAQIAPPEAGEKTVVSGKLLDKLRVRFSPAASPEPRPAPAETAPKAPPVAAAPVESVPVEVAQVEEAPVEAAPVVLVPVVPVPTMSAPAQEKTAPPPPDPEGAQALRRRLRERFSQPVAPPKAPPRAEGAPDASLRDKLREQFRPASPPKIAVVEKQAQAVLSGTENAPPSRPAKARPPKSREAVENPSKKQENPQEVNWGRLAQSSQPGRGPRRFWGVALILSLAAVVSGLAWWYSPESSEHQDPVPKVARKPAAHLPEIAPLAPGFYELWAREREALKPSETTIVPGSSLGKALEEVGVGSRQGGQAIIESLGEGGLSVVRPGAVVKSYWNDLGRTELARLEYYPDSGEAPLVVLPKADGGFLQYSLATMPLTVSMAREGTVSSSLWEAGAKAGLDANVILNITEVLASDIDFFTEIQKDDAFQVLYNRDYSDGRPQGDSTIEMIKLVNKGRVYEYYRFENKDGYVGYYDPEYRSSVKTFFVTPLQYKRISSQFSMARRHPIFKKVRPHQGVDYAAPSGTPVSSVADGTVTFCGWSGGFGKLVTIKHDDTYSTMYAHLSDWAPGLKKGSVVKQGDLIGKVGATGTATGPHLDFRLKKNNVFIDPIPELAKQQGKKIEDKDDQQAFASVVGQIRERMRRQLVATPHDE